MLEARSLLATLTVTTTADDGPGSLRQAILQADNDPFPDSIAFAIPTSDPGYNPPGGSVRSAFWAIRPKSPLPPVTAPVVIDGTTQAGSRPNTIRNIDSDNATLTIELNGGNAGPNAAGLVLAANGCTVRGLVIGGFSGSGLEIDSSGNAVAGNFIGTDTTGLSSQKNGAYGVLVTGAATAGGAANNVIGGPNPADRNIISGNTNDGVLLQSGATGTVVQNNFVGVGSSGFEIVSNGGNGVSAVRSPANTVRGNLIGGNNFAGISLSQGTSRSNVIQGNFIGTDEFGDRLANLTDGILVIGSPNNLIGGTTPAARNIVSFNQGNGISLRGPSATGNVLQGNVVGLSVNGRRPLGNLLNGIFVQNAPGNTIGGVNTLNADGTIRALVGNVISANNQSGISMGYYNDQALGDTSQTFFELVSGGVPDRNLIEGNLIGTGPSGTELGLGNVQEGIFIGSGQNNTIGGTTPGSGNVISGNNTTGITIIGPTVPGVAEGNTRNASHNLVQGNLIGSDVTGRKQVRNLLQGVEIVLGVANTIGGSTPSTRNVISGNKGSGIHITGMFVAAGQTYVARDNQVIGNFIGPDITGTRKLVDPDNPGNTLGNFVDGVLIDSGAANNFIGGTAPGTANVISGNGQSGVNIARSASGNFVRGNLIGTDASGLAPLGNSQDGVRLDNAAANVIGGTDPNAGNVLASNSTGVELTGAGTVRNSILGNFIGTDAKGANPLANVAFGVLVLNGASDDTIGGTDPRARNIISGNGTGVAVLDPSRAGIRILGNYIGTDVTGSRQVGNRQSGVLITGSPGNVIGGSTPGAGNVISGNATAGVFLVAPGSTGNLVQGNKIGTDAGGNHIVANGGEGVLVTNAPGNLIGGAAPGAGNLISGNGQAGVQFQGPTASSNRLSGNLIGTDVTGTVALGNTQSGVILNNAPGNVIGGGSSASERNVISGNRASGVEVLDTGASANVIAGNFLGTDVSGTRAVANGGSGVVVAGPRTVVGGTSAVARNVISGNRVDGVTIASPTATGAVILGNFIGTDLTGERGLGNRGDGVNVDGAARVFVGLSVPGAGNTIADNGLDGVVVVASNSVVVQGNFIGTDAAGTIALGNTVGVRLGESRGNFVAGNLVAGNTDDGVNISGLGASGNIVSGNLIGVDATGRRALSNAVGIHIVGAPGNLIGGSAPGGRNVVSGNIEAGILVESRSSVGNVILGNRVGTDLAGVQIVARPGATTSQPAGVLINRAAGNIVGPGNLISGNDTGVVLAGFLRAQDLPGQALTGNVVVGNAIGTDVGMTRALGNTVGVYINDSARHQVTGNVISGNTATGVTVLGDLSTGNILRANRIGTDGSGSRAVSNGTGVFLQDAPANTIGGTGPADGNLIAGNPTAGLYIFASKASGNVIQGNQIGFARGGSVRQSYGVLLYNAPNNAVPLKGVGANRIVGSRIANVREFTGASGTAARQTTSGVKSQGRTSSRAVPSGPLGSFRQRRLSRR